jgi:hypothetical protein
MPAINQELLAQAISVEDSVARLQVLLEDSELAVRVQVQVYLVEEQQVHRSVQPSRPPLALVALRQQLEVVSSAQSQRLVVYLEHNLRRNHLVVCLEIQEILALAVLGQRAASAQAHPPLEGRSLETTPRLTSQRSASETRSQQLLPVRDLALLPQPGALEAEVYSVTTLQPNLPLDSGHNSQLQAILLEGLGPTHNNRLEHLAGSLAIRSRSQRVDSSAPLLQLLAPVGVCLATRPRPTPIHSAVPPPLKIPEVYSATNQLLLARVFLALPTPRTILVVGASFLDSATRIKISSSKTTTTDWRRSLWKFGSSTATGRYVWRPQQQ